MYIKIIVGFIGLAAIMSFMMFWYFLFTMSQPLHEGLAIKSLILSLLGTIVFIVMDKATRQ
jgi:uncharacterized membrane protein YeaQ/YmgE (transglycosylase-associated protein family)